MVFEVSPVKTALGSVTCLGSAVWGAVAGDNPAIVIVGVMAGVALGAVGIWQTIEGKQHAGWKRLVVELEAALAEAKADARRKREQDLDEISDLGFELRETRRALDASRCPWTDQFERARCHGEPMPKPIEPDEVFTQQTEVSDGK
jgi:hypothetical protein